MSAVDIWRQALRLDALEEQEKLPRGALTAIMSQESGGHPGLESSAGARGLFQFMPKTAESYGIDPYDPWQAAPVAAREFGTLYRKYGDLPKALAAWNWGQGNLDQQGMQRAPDETRGFVSNVLGALSPRSAAAAGKQEGASPDVEHRVQQYMDILNGPSAVGGASVPAPASTGMPPTASALPAAKAPTEPVLPVPLAAVPAQTLDMRQSSEIPAAHIPAGETQPSHMVINIEKDLSPPLPGQQPRQPLPDASAFLSGDLIEDVSQNGQQGLALPGTLAEAAEPLVSSLRRGYQEMSGPYATGIEGGLSMGGAMLGAGTGVLAPVAIPGLSALGGYAGHRINQALGLKPGSPELYPRTFDDYLALGAPLLPSVLQAGGRALRWTRGGRALTTAETQTRAALEQSLQDFQAAEARYQAEVMSKQTAYDVDLAGREAMRRAEVQSANTRAIQATQDAIKTWETGGQAEVEKAIAKAQQEQATARQLMQDIDAHRQAVERVRALPGQYMPQMPERNMVDVRRDLALLEQGGAQADAVVKRVGAANVADAAAKLSDEGQKYFEAGQAIRRPSGEEIPSPYPVKQPRLPKQEAVDLEQFVKNHKGIKLQGETELVDEFADLITAKEVGRKDALLNNKSGLPPDRMAELAMQARYEGVTDKKSFLDALRNNRAGRRVYSLDDTIEAPAFEASPASAIPSAKPPSVSMAATPRGDGRDVSRVLYQRLEEVAGSAPVNLEPAIESAMELKDWLNTSMPSMRNGAAQKAVDDLLLMKDRGSVAQVNRALQDIGPLARSQDSKTRYMANRVLHSLQDSVELSSVEWTDTAGAWQIAKQAKAAWRQESAVKDIQDLLRPNGPVLKVKNGEWVMNPDALMGRIEQMLVDKKRYPFFEGSFSPEALARLRADVASYQGTPAMPRGLPPAPDAAPLPGLVDVGKIGPRPEPVPPKNIRPVEVWRRPEARAPGEGPLEGVEPKYQPGEAPTYEAPAPAEPEIKPFKLRQGFEGGAITIGVMHDIMRGKPGIGTAVAGTILGLEAFSYGLAKAMLIPSLRPAVLAAMKSGQFSPALYGIFGALAAKDGVGQQGREEANPFTDSTLPSSPPLPGRRAQAASSPNDAYPALGLERAPTPWPIAGGIR